MTQRTPGSFQRVSAMNVAFGNPKGNPLSVNWSRIARQSLNIPDELGELVIALGGEPAGVKAAVAEFKGKLLELLAQAHESGPVNVDAEGVRDALCDIHVFG